MESGELSRLCKDRGWSRTRLIHEMRRVAMTLGQVLPEDDSLKRMLRLWANGSRGLSPMYADILTAVFGTPVGEETETSGIDPELEQRLEQAGVVDSDLVRLFERQTDAYRLLDRRTGAARLLGQTEQHVQHLSELLPFCRFGSTREALAAAVAEAAALAGWQALDQGNVNRSWALHSVAQSAAQESQDPAVLAHVTAQQAYALLDAGHADRAVSQIVHARTTSGARAPALVRGWLFAAEAEARAATRDEVATRRALEQAAQLVDEAEGDSLPYLSLDRAHLARWQGHCLAKLGTSDAVASLTASLVQLEAGFTRASAGMRCDLALAHLRAGDPEAAGRHAEEARRLASATASTRQARRIQRLVALTVPSARG